MAAAGVGHAEQTASTFQLLSLPSSVTVQAFDALG
jgi:hypothetical protein